MKEYIAFDNQDRPSSFTNVNGSKVNFEYNSKGFLATESVKADHPGRWNSDVDYSYNNNDIVSGISQKVSGLAEGKHTISNQYTYDDEDRMTKITHNDFMYNFEYDPNGNNTAVKIADQTLAEFEYDSQNNLKQVSYGTGDKIYYEMSETGDIASIDYESGGLSERAFSYNYDKNGEMTVSEDHINGYTMTPYGKDGFNIKASGNEVVHFVTTTDKEKTRVEQINQASSISTTPSQSSYNHETGELINTSSVSTRGHVFNRKSVFDPFGRPTNSMVTNADISLISNVLYDDSETTATQIMKGYTSTFLKNGTPTAGLDWSYTYDNRGNIKSITGSDGLVSSYVYDEAGQLVREDKTTVEQINLGENSSPERYVSNGGFDDGSCVALFSNNRSEAYVEFADGVYTDARLYNHLNYTFSYYSKGKTQAYIEWYNANTLAYVRTDTLSVAESDSWQRFSWVINSQLSYSCRARIRITSKLTNDVSYVDGIMLEIGNVLHDFPEADSMSRNLVADGSFETWGAINVSPSATSMGYWMKTNLAIRDNNPANNPPHGDYCIRSTATVYDDSVSVQYDWYIPVEGLKQYCFSYYYIGSGQAVLSWYNENDTFIGSTSSTTSYGSPGVWNRFSKAVTAPAGAKYCSIDISMWDGSSTVLYGVDGVMMHEGSTPNDYYNRIPNMINDGSFDLAFDSSSQTHTNNFWTVYSDNDVLDSSVAYTYDTGGNIVSRKEYTYTDNQDELITTVAYTYDSIWKDKLTSYNGVQITYDAMGNPLMYGDATFDWFGRELRKYETPDVTVDYKYNVSGFRTSKSIVQDGKTTSYTYTWSETGALLGYKVRISNKDNYIQILYDENKSPVSFLINNDAYYYIKNLQGDVCKVVDSNGNVVVEYTYDAWGKMFVDDKYLDESAFIYNPVTYKGYYFDHETGFYYLQSRYYNPEWGRFINADIHIDTERVFGANTFAYCGNNPVRYLDASGGYYSELEIALLLKWYTGFLGESLANQAIMMQKVGIVLNAQDNLFERGFIFLNPSEKTHFSLLEDSPIENPIRRYDIYMTSKQPHELFPGANFFAFKDNGIVFKNGWKELSLRYRSNFWGIDVHADFGVRFYDEWLGYLAQNCVSRTQEFLSKISDFYDGVVGELISMAVDLAIENGVIEAISDLLAIPDQSGNLWLAMQVVDDLASYFDSKIDEDFYNYKGRCIRAELRETRRKVEEKIAKGLLPKTAILGFNSEGPERIVVYVLEKIERLYINKPALAANKVIYSYNYPFYTQGV